MVHLRRYFLPVLALLLLLAAVLISFSNTPTLAQDCTSASISRVSVASGGGQGNGDSYLSAYQTISADGLYVVFTSSSALVPQDTNVCGYFSCGDVYVRDRQNGETERVSVATGGAQGNLASGDGVIMPDGRYVAFSSEADNLVSGDTNGVRDIFVHDRQTGETRRVSVDSAGNQANNYSDYPVISGDGQIIAFQSYASNLVSDDTNGVDDIFVRDLQNSTTTRISVSSTGTQGNGWSTIPAMSANGQFVIFESRATNLVEGDYDGQLYLHDRLTGATSLVSVNSANEAAAGFVIKGSISDDGRFISFHSDAANLASGYTPDYWFDIFLRDRQTGQTTLLAENPDAGRQFTEGSSRISFSQGERYLAFASTAANTGSDSSLGEYDVFILDTQTGQTKIATHSWDATPPYNSSFSPSLSADGKFVVFDSWQEDLVPGDTNLQRDVFVASVDCLPLAPTPTPTEEVTPEVTPTEEVTPEVTPTEETTPEATLTEEVTPEITPTEEVTPEATPIETATPEVTPTEEATPEVTPETTPTDTPTPPVCTNASISRISTAFDGTQSNDHSWFSSVSADGRYIAFDSYASNLVPDDTNNARDVFVYDRDTGEMTRISVATGGAQGNDESKQPSISADGRFVAFESKATNLVLNDTNSAPDSFIHDRTTAQTSRIPDSAYGERPTLSANGDFVAFSSYVNNTDVAFVHEIQTGETTQIGEGYAPSLSADGRFVAFDSSASNLVPDDTNGEADVFVYDRDTGQVARLSVAANGTEGNGYSEFGVISADGRFVSFLSNATNLVSDDTNDVDDIFVVERQTGLISRVSVASDGTQSNHLSYYPTSLSADGRLVVFSSIATNLVPDDTSDSTDIFLHDQLAGETIRLSVAADASEANGLSNWPSISSDGRFVTFSSDASNLAPGDTNNVRDIFIVELECLPQQPTPTPEVTPTEEVTPEVTPTAAPTSLPNAVPQRNYITTQPVTLTWNSVTLAVRYQVQVDTSTAFTAPIMDAPTPELQLSPLEPRTYFWRVRAIRANNTPGAWSAVETFTVGMP